MVPRSLWDTGYPHPHPPPMLALMQHVTTPDTKERSATSDTLGLAAGAMADSTDMRMAREARLAKPHSTSVLTASDRGCGHADTLQSASRAGRGGAGRSGAGPSQQLAQ